METGRTNHYDKVLDSVLGEKNFVNYYMAVGLSVENPFNYHEIAEYKKGTGGFFKKFIGCFLGFIPGRTVLADIESESKSAKNEHDPSDYNLKYDGLGLEKKLQKRI